MYKTVWQKSQKDGKQNEGDHARTKGVCAVANCKVSLWIQKMVKKMVDTFKYLMHMDMRSGHADT